MAHPRQPEQVKIILGLLYPSTDQLAKIERAIEQRFGEIDLRTEPMQFTYTDYYAKEMGPKLFRSWCSVKELASPGELADWKIWSNTLENSWSQDGKRVVNIDPGYISLSKVVLASAKNFLQRIYLRDGIYGEITLIFQGNSYYTLPWTYPDYADLIPTLNTWRKVLKKQMAK